MTMFSSSKPISALTSEEWEVFEASAEKMGSAIVSYLKNIVGDVHSIVESQQSSVDGVPYETVFGRANAAHGQPNGHSESEDRCRDFKFDDQKVICSLDYVTERDRVSTSKNVRMNTQIDYQSFLERMRDPRASTLRHDLQATKLQLYRPCFLPISSAITTVLSLNSIICIKICKFSRYQFQGVRRVSAKTSWKDVGEDARRRGSRSARLWHA